MMDAFETIRSIMKRLNIPGYKNDYMNETPDIDKELLTVPTKKLLHTFEIFYCIEEDSRVYTYRTRSKHLSGAVRKFYQEKGIAKPIDRIVNIRQVA